jgi:hypothetical protein
MSRSKVDLDEFAGVGGRATSGRHRRRFEWFAQVSEDLSDRPRVRGQEVRSNRRLPRVRRPGMVSHSESSLKAISRMSPPHAGHSSGNSSPTRARSLAQAIREVSCERGF